ncbi:MAG: hypothetical protein ACOC9T_00065 [Myxococcota bacterium]
MPDYIPRYHAPTCTAVLGEGYCDCALPGLTPCPVCGLEVLDKEAHLEDVHPREWERRRMVEFGVW